MIGGHDPMAMPAPPQILLFLLGLTFVLHLAMLGLLFASLWARAGAEWGRPAGYDTQRVHRAGVVGMSMTITMGVPPLLFVQVLYGKYFYASSISIGFPWLAIVGYLLAGFYAMYWAQWAWLRHQGPSWTGKLSWLLTVLCVIAIGFTYSWNHLKSLSATPWTNDVFHPDALLRLSGYFGAALVGAAAWASWLGGNWRLDHRLPRGTGIAAMVGGAGLLIWTLVSDYASAGIYVIDRPLQLIAALTSLVAGALVVANRGGGLTRWLLTIGAPLGMLGLLVQRETWRLAALGPLHSPFAETVRTQWSAVALFAATFILGLGVLLWLVLQIRRLRTR